MQLEGLVEDIVALAEIPAPTFAEEARLAWLEERLSGARGRRERDGAGNLVWSWGERPPRVLVAAHVDTVFGADTPLGVSRQNGALVGPGVGDNATAVAAVVHVVESLLAECELAPGAVVFTVGEEGPGNLRGANAACEALAPEALVAVEGHWLDRVVVDAVGSVRAQVSVSGRGGHSWDDRGRASAVHALVEIGARLLMLGSGSAPVNIGRVCGGSAVNAIAAKATLEVEMRATAESPLTTFRSELARLADAADDELAVDVALIGRRPPGALRRDAPLLALVREVRAELGLPDRLAAGSSDAAVALARGIPGLCLGITTGAGMHTLSERVDTEPLALGCRQLREVLARLLSPIGGTGLARSRRNTHTID